MQLQGMSDQQFEEIVLAAEDVKYLIVKAGGMATKSAVEDVLMKRYRMNRGDAHSITNYLESQNKQKRNWQVLQRGLTWLAERDEPQYSNYPEIGTISALSNK